METPPVFALIARAGNVSQRDMFNTFNMGVGMCLTVAAADADAAVRILREAGEDAAVIGSVVAGDSRVELV